MRLHRIIAAIPGLTIEQIKAISLSKGECFANLDETFDYALPQNWLDEFSSWCSKQPKGAVDFTHVGLGVDYDMIASTTVWSYPANASSGPVTCCAEVLYAYNKYANFLEEKTHPFRLTP